MCTIWGHKDSEYINKVFVDGTKTLEKSFQQTLLIFGEIEAKFRITWFQLPKKRRIIDKIALYDEMFFQIALGELLLHKFYVCVTN